jgi:Na+-transporting NADH:ubiquinone oxidoreductase subunit F
MIYLASLLMLCILGLAFAVALTIAEKLLADYGTCSIKVNEEEPFTVEGGGTLLDALYGERIFIPSACFGKGTCGFCKVTVPDGGGPLLPTEKPFLTRADIDADTRLACQVKVKQDLQIQVRPEYLNVQEFSARVSSARMLTHDIREIHLALIEPEEIEFRPGQYVQVKVPAAEPTFRAYSVSSAPEEKGEIELIVRLIPGGLGSTYLHRVKVGDELDFTGPYGEFELSESADTDVVCVGGGCGLAPIKSIIHYVYKRWPERKVWLFFGARSAQDVFYLQEFEEFAKKHPALQVCYALSEPEADDKWDGPTGFIHKSVDERLPEGPNRQAFLCGPPPMVEATIEVLGSKQVGEDKVFYDKF